MRASGSGWAPGWASVLALAAGVALAQEQVVVPVETAVLGDNLVTIRLYPFLTPEEVSLLRLVATNAEALALFVPEAGGYAAMAVAPDEGMVRDGVPVPSAVAVGQLPDAEAARAGATGQCNAARASQRKRDALCLVVLEVAPQT